MLLQNGRPVKNEVDFKIGTFLAPDGRRLPARNGKPLAAMYEPAKKDQEEKKAALTSGEDRRNQHVKHDLEKKAKNLQL